MKIRLARVSVLLMTIVGLVATAAPPAHAFTIGGITFEGIASVPQGFGYPCIGSGGPVLGQPDLSKCPVTGTGNTVSQVTFNGSGVGQVDTGLKGKCPPIDACVEAGTVQISATGTITGWCGDSSGTLSGTVSASLSVGPKSLKTRTFTITYTALGGVLLISGNVTNPTKPALIVGVAVAVPNETDGSTCFNKNAKNFIVAGIINIIQPNIP